MDWSSDEGQQILWRISTRILETLTEECKPLKMPGAEAFAVLMISIGRFAGSVGFRSYGSDRAWEHFISVRTFFDHGFKNERAHES